MSKMYSGDTLEATGIFFLWYKSIQNGRHISELDQITILPHLVHRTREMVFKKLLDCSVNVISPLVLIPSMLSYDITNSYLSDQPLSNQKSARCIVLSSLRRKVCGCFHLQPQVDGDEFCLMSLYVPIRPHLHCTEAKLIQFEPELSTFQDVYNTTAVWEIIYERYRDNRDSRCQLSM